MVKSKFLRMAVLSMLGLGAYQTAAVAQDGVARTSGPINALAATPNYVGGHTGQYYIVTQQPHAYQPPNPTY